MAGITAIPHHDDIASSSTASCSASASDPCVKCDIYINHCEKDAGNFATELCNLLQSLGLQVFLDKLEFDSEEEVTSRMETAISQAAVRIAIFSPNYANWRWCLDALVNMTKSGGTIIPVFYEVGPSEVRWTGGEYAAWMLDHEEKLRYNSETIQIWRDALNQVSHISGLELEKCNGDEQDLSRKVVQSVFKDSPGLRHNVFLSHRGPDTKEIFASPLYDRLLSHGIRAFLDTRELVEGFQIAPQLELAIQFASVNIVIFSPRFAESPWCLEELFLMTKSTATILPVFYEVNPSDLNGRYVEALFDHLKKPRSDADTIERWRYALADVPDLNDFVLDGNKEELIDKIAQSVSEILSKPSEVGESYEVVQSTAKCVLKENVPKQSKVVQRAPVERDYVGLSEKIRDFEKAVLSQQEEPVEAKVVGILGGVGLGKTTMAKCYFNRRKSYYSEFSFLYNVRKRALKDLQSEVIKELKHGTNIRIESVEEGVEMFKQLLPSCHALVILDDVDHVDQLDALLPIKCVLHPNSLILVTSRDKDVLNRSGIADSSIYHLAGLNTQNSKSLLLSYARPSGVLTFENMVDKFVTTCNGLPLALKVLGVLLSGKRRPVWEEQLKRLHDCILPVEIEYSLKNSYDSLDPEEQEIFLDVACLFTGQDRDTAIRIWGMAGLKKLENRCVVQVCNNNKIEMNGLLGNYGRNIARRLEPRRLWNQETKQINDLLEKSSSELAQFRGITMNRGPRDETEMPCCKQSGEKFSGTSNLKFLAAQGGYVENILTRVGSPDLLWLNWYKCTRFSLPSWISMKTLRVLEVDGSKLTELWQPESQPPFQLRELNIFAPLSEFPKSIGQLVLLEKIVVKYSGPLPFKTLPEEFYSLLSLKHLELINCSRMMSLPDSFGDLKNLQYLDLKGASSLRMLPKSFGNLTLLKYLSLKGCSEIRELPGLEHVTSLETLDVRACKNLESIPELGQLKRLQILDVRGCSQIQTPLGLEHLISLKTLNVSGCEKLQTLPGLGLLTKLRKIDVSECRMIRKLPGVEQLTSLEELNVRGCGMLESIPELGLLTKLRKIAVSECWMIRKLPGVEQLTFLEELNVSGCCKLQSIPELGQLTKLQILDVSGCSMLRKLKGLKHLTQLKMLNVRECDGIRELPGVEYLTSLEMLDVKCIKMPRLEQLTRLRELNLSSLDGIPELPSLEHLTSLETLTVFDFPLIQSIQGSGLERLISLKELKVSGCHKLESMPELAHLTNLETLSVIECGVIQTLPPLGDLISLKALNVSGCKKLRSMPGLEHVTNLKTLCVHECHEIETFPLLGDLISLKALYVTECKKLRSMPGLGDLISLKTLDVIGCEKLRSMPGLEQLISLKRLIVINCEKLQSIPELGRLTELQELSVMECGEIRTLPGLEQLISLKMLIVNKCEKLQSIPELGRLTELQELRVMECGEIRTLPGLEQLISLKMLIVNKCEKLQSIPELGRLTELQELRVMECGEIRTLPGLEQLISLKMLIVNKCEKLQSIPELGRLTELQELRVMECGEIRTLPGLEQLISLKILIVNKCEKLQSIPELGRLTELQELRVMECGEIRTLPGLEQLISLKMLIVNKCEKLQSIPELGRLTELQELRVMECGEIRTLPGLEQLISLKMLIVNKCEKLQSIPELGRLTELPELRVMECGEIRTLPGLESLIFKSIRPLIHLIRTALGALGALGEGIRRFRWQ